MNYRFTCWLICIGLDTNITLPAIFILDKLLFVRTWITMFRCICFHDIIFNGLFIEFLLYVVKEFFTRHFFKRFLFLNYVIYTSHSLIDNLVVMSKKCCEIGLDTFSNFRCKRLKVFIWSVNEWKRRDSTKLTTKMDLFFIVKWILHCFYITFTWEKLVYFIVKWCWFCAWNTRYLRNFIKKFFKYTHGVRIYFILNIFTNQIWGIVLVEIYEN